MSNLIPFVPQRRTAFVRNADLLRQIADSKRDGAINVALARSMLLMVTRFFSRGNYRCYSFVDELRQEALVQLVYAGLKFDDSRSQNPFAYYTSVMANAANRILNKEKRQRLIRDELLIEEGMPPSFTAQLEHEIAQAVEQHAADKRERK